MNIRNVNIAAITVKERIRKEVDKIGELAADIAANGLLNPITVMALNGAENNNGEGFQLLAGLRRLRAVKSLGWQEVAVNVVTPADAEQALRMEYSENNQRSEFTFTEKMEYARVIGEIESAKAQARMLAGKKAETENPVDERPQGIAKKSRDIIGEKIGMSGRQYDRAKYVAENAPSEVLDALDNKEKSVDGAYNELRAKEKAEQEQSSVAVFDTPTDEVRKFVDEHFLVVSVPPLEEDSESEVEKDNGREPAEDDIADDEQEEDGNDDDEPDYEAEDIPFVDEAPATFPLPMPPPPQLPAPTKLQKLEQSESERLRKLNEYEALTLDEKVTELERRLDAEHLRANRAESALADFKYKTHNDIYHRDCEIVRLKNSNNELTAALEAANAKIAGLEGTANV